MDGLCPVYENVDVGQPNRYNRSDRPEHSGACQSVPNGQYVDKTQCRPTRHDNGYDHAWGDVCTERRSHSDGYGNVYPKKYEPEHLPRRNADEWYERYEWYELSLIHI